MTFRSSPAAIPFNRISLVVVVQSFQRERRGGMIRAGGLGGSSRAAVPGKLANRAGFSGVAHDMLPKLEVATAEPDVT